MKHRLDVAVVLAVSILTHIRASSALLRAKPTPAGVPGAITSPASSVVVAAMNGRIDLGRRGFVR
jgi:hypothetical protein